MIKYLGFTVYQNGIAAYVERVENGVIVSRNVGFWQTWPEVFSEILPAPDGSFRVHVHYDNAIFLPR